jgi:hypothetical protein
MTESSVEEPRKVTLKRRLGKIGLVLGFVLMGSVIIFGLLTSLVSAYGGSIQLVQTYNTLAAPIFVFGILLAISGLLALYLPEGMSKDGTWSLQTGPLR